MAVNEGCGVDIRRPELEDHVEEEEEVSNGSRERHEHT